MLRKIRNIKPGDPGYTLLEVMVSMLVFSFGVLGAIGMTIAAMRGNKDSTERVQAAALTLMVTNRIISGSIDWDSVGGDDSCTANGAGSDNQACTNEDLLEEGYILYWIICNEDSDLTGGYKDNLCDVPAENLDGSKPYPDALACDPDQVDKDEKEIRLLIVWNDGQGNCRHFDTRTITVDPDA
jgi:hypothetical protein